MTEKLPPRPWDWITSAKPSGNGMFHIYLIDATGRKIATIFGKGEEKVAVANHLLQLVNRDIPDWSPKKRLP